MSTLSPTRKRRAGATVLALGLALGLAAMAGAGPSGSLKAATPAPTAAPTPSMPSFADLVEAVSPAVVSIEVVHEAGFLPAADRRTLLPERFKRFFGEDFARRFGERRGPPPPRGGSGSGFVVDAAGYVVTADHVVAGAETVTVILDDGARLEAALVGRDPRTDLALLKVEADAPLPAVRFAGADATRVGDGVVAVGNPFGLGKTATFGIVSARGRGPDDDHLQIDAPINRGNSGGPSFNLRGEVVGVNTAIVSPSGGNVGIGFAVPAATARAVIDDLKAHGRVMRGWLGVHIQEVTEDIAAGLGLARAEGAIVTRVQPESPAAAAGLAPGDVIVAVDREAVEGPRALARAVAAIAAGESARLTLWRNGRSLELTATIAHAAASGAADADGPARLEGLGLRLESIDPALRGDTLGRNTGAQDTLGRGAVAVAGVAPGSPAARKGVRPGDTVVAVGGAPVGSVAEATARLEAARADGRKTALFLLERDGQRRFVALPFEAS